MPQPIDVLYVGWWEMHVSPTIDSSENNDNHSKDATTTKKMEQKENFLVVLESLLVQGS